jgi:putative membrane protein
MHALHLHLKRVSWFAFIAGLTVFALLVGFYGIGDIVAIMAVAGIAGLALIAATHILPLAAEAIGWGYLFERTQRPRFRTLIWTRWIGESVDTLLPVAQVGGDLVRVRLLAKLGMPATLVAATLVTDVTLALVTLIIFTLLGVVLLASYVTTDGLVLPVLLAVLVSIAAVGGFYLAQQRGLFGILARLLQNFVGPLDAKFVDGADAIDRESRRIYARRKDILLNALWQSGAYLLGALEVWIALWLLGYPVTLFEAFLIESLVQGVRTAAFFIPGALGAQEGGFLVVGTLLSLPAEAALALALTRRVRELVFGIPGILAWQWFEARSQWAGKSQCGDAPADPALLRDRRD